MSKATRSLCSEAGLGTHTVCLQGPCWTATPHHSEQGSACRVHGIPSAYGSACCLADNDMCCSNDQVPALCRGQSPVHLLNVLGEVFWDWRPPSAGSAIVGCCAVSGVHQGWDMPFHHCLPGEYQKSSNLRALPHPGSLP